MPLYLTWHLWGYVFHIKVKTDTSKEGAAERKLSAQKRLDKSKNRHSAK